MRRWGRGGSETGANRALGAAASVDLNPAQEHPSQAHSRRSYRIGRFTLQPYRELVRDSGPVPIGRKPLALLSALAEAGGELVTKDELVAAAWPKMIVDDNALQVHIAGLRKVLGSEADLLTTVRGLGYRLEVSKSPTRPQQYPRSFLPADGRSGDPTKSYPTRLVAGQRRRWVIAATAAVFIIAAATILPLSLYLRGVRGASERVTALSPFQFEGADAGLRTLRDRLGEAISSALSNNDLEVTSAPPGRARLGGLIWSRASVEFRVAGAAWRDGAAYHVHVHLDDARRDLVLWSDDFSGPVSAPASLEANVAARTAEAAMWAHLGRTGPAKLEPSALSAFIVGREGTTGVRGDEAALIHYERVVAMSPNFSWGHSAIAVTQGFALRGRPSTPSTQATMVAARAEADRALQLDPHNGEAYLALELLTPQTAWSRRESLLLKGAAVDPDFEPVAMMEGRLLWAVGRARDATEWLQRAHNIEPFHNGATWSLALNLASQGWSAESHKLRTQMSLQWPEHYATRDVQFWTRLVAGDTEPMLALLDDQTNWPSDVDEGSVKVWRAAFGALDGRHPRAKPEAVQLVLAAADSSALSHGRATTLLAMLGDLDDALAQARLYRPPDPYAPPYLFLPTTANLLVDRRFMLVARDLGLVSYWRTSGHWPDFCRNPSLPYSCSV